MENELDYLGYQLNQQRFDITLSSIGDAVISTDRKGRILFMNPVAEKLTGWSLKEAYKKPSSVIFHIINEETRCKTVSPITRVIKTGKIAGLANHTILVRKDSTEIPIDDSGAPIIDERGNITGVVLVFRDISERKKTERLLLRSEASLKKSQEIAHLGSWELDLRQNTLTWSDEIYRIFGLKPNEFKATYEAFLDTIHPEDREHVDHAYQRSLKENRNDYEVEHRIVRKNSGEIRYVHEKGFHIKDQVGNIIISIGMVHDITERKIAELALKESEQRVRQKLESILYPDGTLNDLELKDIIDCREIQEMMECLYELTSVAMAIIDKKGEVMVGAGWQDICTKFHRVHPDSCKNCLQSDTVLTSGIPEGEFKLYKCANGMWDIATPLIIGGLHIGNLLMGQFFFEDEEIDLEAFKRRAQIYGFDPVEYLSAVNRASRISKSKLESAKGFFLRFANKISKLSYSNIKLSRSIGEREIIHKKLTRNNQRLDILSDTAGRLLASTNPQEIIDELCLKVMQFLECDIFVNYIMDQSSGKLHLNASSGFDEETLKSIQWLNLGVAVCGCVARQGKRIIAENIQDSTDRMTNLVRSLGVQAYCCHPLIGQGDVIGTLSFGTKKRQIFAEEEISMMKMMADLVSIAMNRIKDHQLLLESEKQAKRRAEELQKMMDIVPSAIWIAQDPSCKNITGNATANSFYEAKEGENVSAGDYSAKNVRRFFRDGKELTAEELTMQMAASTGKDVINSELEVLLPSGKWMTMLGNASPLKDENGQVRGCVGAFMDISQRKNAEKESKMMIGLLRIANESRNTKDFIHSSLEFFQKNIDFDAIGLRLKEGDDYPYFETIGFSKEFCKSEKYLCARDRQGKIMLDNNNQPVLECLCGQVIIGNIDSQSTFTTEYGSIYANCTSEFNVSDLEKKLNCRIRNRCNRDGFESVTLVPLKLGNENIGLLQLNDRRKGLVNNNKIELIEKLTGPFTHALARFLAEEELIKKEDNLRQHAEMLEHAPVLVRNLKDEITVWNAGMEKLYGYNFTEAIGKNINKLLKTEYPQSYDLIMNNFIQNNYWEGELKHQCKNGTKLDILSLWTLHKDQQGNPIAIIEVNNDITNRKKKEAELKKLNRVLNALGKSSQIMMQSHNELDYVENVCKILVEDCGHTLVWIGYAQNDENKLIKPIAHYGFDEKYIENLKVSWADNEWGNGPSGMSIKTCKPVVCRKINEDPGFKPWRRNAGIYGYQSSIALPLISEERAFGVLAIYSKEVDSFSADEIDLLTSLSQDLAFGINTIRLKESENKALILLTESEEKYRTLFNEMSEGFAYLEMINDAKGNPRDYRIINVNPAFEKHTGLTDDVIGMKASEIYGSLNIYWINVYAEVAFLGKNKEFEIYNAFLEKFFKVSAFSSKQGYIAVIFENITERVLAEKELQSTKNYLESLINNANAPIIVWNSKLQIKLFNRAFEHLTGYKSEEVYDKKVEMLFPSSSVKEIKNKIQQALYENWESLEIPILTKTNEIRTVLWNSANIYDQDNNNLISVIAQGNDITERKKAEQKLSEAQEKLNLALDNGNIGTWEKDLRNDSLVWDKRMEKMFGFEEGAFDGKNETFEKCLVEEDIPYIRETLRKSIEEDSPYEIVYRIKTTEDNINYINAKALIIKNKLGIPIRLSGVCFDVTDMKKGAERVLIKLNEDLLRSNKELEQFAYVASHDLQEPLRMVANFTQLLASRYKDKLDDNAKEFIHYAVDGATRMQSLINDLLNYSRIGTRGKNFVRVDFNEIFQKAINNLRLSILEKNAIIICDKLPVVLGDEIQMVQLMQNLIGNALKFCDTIPEVHVKAEENSTHYVFSVKDNGIGIDEQYFSKIFLIFQRLMPRNQYSGTGIGLSICKRIVERHGGKIWVDSEVGKGTTFYFSLTKNIPFQ
jgi:PAS domain S-box-containing protein